MPLPVLLPSSVNIVSKTAKQVTSERAAEEEQIRQQYLAQMATIEQQAKAKFETDLAAKRAAAMAEFEAGLTAEKSRSTFETDLAAEEASARTKFEAQITAQRKRAVEAPIRAAKREYAMIYRLQMVPRQYRVLKRSAEQTYATLAQAEREQMQTEIKTWKAEELKKQEEAVSAWESEQRKSFEQDLASWESEAKKGLEAEITGWKSEQMAALEPQLAEWRKAWQPKGLAERMAEISIPSLALDVRLAEALGTKYIVSKKSPVFLTTPKAAIKEAHVHPLAAPAGIIGSVESLVYSVGQLAGLKTPKIPATLTGGLITSGIESLVSGQFKASPEMQQILEMPPEYAAGTVLGDVLVAMGISKGVKAGTKMIKGAASFVYEESGLKYSHALYRAKEISLKVSEMLPKSPISAIKESKAVYEITDAISSFKHKIMPTKYMKQISEGIIGLPTLEEEAAFKGMAELKETSKALQTAKAVGVTPLGYAKAVYPKIFTGMELLGWAEAPHTAAFGLTVPAKLAETTVGIAVKASPLAEALAETMWIGATAQEKWMARADFLKETWIEKPPKIDVGLKMIKGGRKFTIPQADILGFTKLPRISPASSGEFFFQKQGKLPTVKDLLKDIRGEATTTQLLESPAKIIEPVLPKLAMIPEAAGKITLSQVIGIGAVIGLKPQRKARVKPFLQAAPLSAAAMKSIVSPVSKAKAAQSPLQREVAMTKQALKAVSISVRVMKPPSLLPKKMKKEEPFLKLRKVEIFGKKPKVRMAKYLYPVATVGEAAEYVLGKKVRRKR